MISSLSNTIHHPEMDRNSPKTVFGYPRDRVIIITIRYKKTKTLHMQSFHPVECIYQCTTAYTG